MQCDRPDAVVVGAGHNGLVLESQPEPGGAVRSGALTCPGFVHDLFSAFYPLATVSPVLRGLDLESFGLRWRYAPLVLAHPTPDGRCAVLSTDVEETARSLDTYANGDGRAWRRLYGLWERVSGPSLESLLSPFPPVVPATHLAARLGPAGVLRFARHVTLPVRRMAEEEFAGAGGGLLLAGNALHTDLAPENAGSGLFGWLLCCAGQQHGFPVPEEGAGQLVAALVRRLKSRGGHVECGTRVARIELRKGRAVGVRTADGRRVTARRAVLAGVVAPQLYLDLVGANLLRVALSTTSDAFSTTTPRSRWTGALAGPIPWKCETVRRAGTVHLARSPAGSGRRRNRAFRRPDAGPDRTPGPWFGDLVLGRHVFTRRALTEVNEILVRGALNLGTAQLHQQLVFRPTPGLARPETPIRNLYLASASAHPVVAYTAALEPTPPAPPSPPPGDAAGR